jgi:hypothetical protein
MTGLCLLKLELRTDSSDDVVCDPTCPTFRNLPKPNRRQHITVMHQQARMPCQVRFNDYAMIPVMIEPRWCSDCCRVRPISLSFITSWNLVKCTVKRCTKPWSTTFTRHSISPAATHRIFRL